MSNNNECLLITSDSIYSSVEDLFKNYNPDQKLSLTQEQIDEIERIEKATGLKNLQEVVAAMLYALLVNNPEIKGGNGELVPTSSAVTPYTNRLLKVNKFDFIAVIMFILSIYTLYLSYKQFNNIACTIIGDNAGEVITENVKSALKDVSFKEVSFFAYIFKVFTNFSKSMFVEQSERMRDNITKIIMGMIPDFKNEIMTTCYPGGSQNMLENVITSYISPSSTTECITKVTSMNMEKYLLGQKYMLDKILLSLSTSTRQVQDLASWGSYTGYACITYFGARRAGYIPGRLLKNGGKKNKSNKKNNKSNKKKNNSNKKNKKTRVKH